MESEDGRGEGQANSPPHLRPYDFSEPGSFGLVGEGDAEFIRMNALAHLSPQAQEQYAVMQETGRISPVPYGTISHEVEEEEGIFALGQ